MFLLSVVLDFTLFSLSKRPVWGLDYLDRCSPSWISTPGTAAAPRSGPHTAWVALAQASQTSGRACQQKQSQDMEKRGKHGWNNPPPHPPQPLAEAHLWRTLMLCNETPRINRGKERPMVSCVWTQKIFFPRIASMSATTLSHPVGHLWLGESPTAELRAWPPASTKLLILQISC